MTSLHRTRTVALHGVAVLVAAVCLSACSGTGGDAPGVATARRSPVAEADDGGTTNERTAAVLDEYVARMKERVGCLREHGLPGQPDPDRLGRIVIDQRTQSDPAAVDRALDACHDVGNVPMPPEVRALAEAEQAEAVSPAQKRVYADYATCMQQHGAPDFPDPRPDGLPGDSAWNQTAAGARTATAACASIIGDPVTTGPGLG